MATTRAATFSAKIRTLSDFHARIISQQQQAPSSAEIVTTLRYFQQTLVGFLKEIPSERSALFEQYSSEMANIRAGLYPNLNYSGLFYGIVNLLDAFPMLASAQSAIAEAILDTLKALYFFLDRDCIDQMPMLLAAQLGVFPTELDRRLVHMLCHCILPYAFGEGTNGRVSVPAVLILILHHPADPSLHTMAIESLASRLPDLYTDLLTVIASGTSEARIAAANLLFHYWPLMNPAILHRPCIQYRINAWSAPPCQNVQCAEKGPSFRYTFEPALCATIGDSSPPVFLCRTCADQIGTTTTTNGPMHFLCQPLPAVISATCQNKGCSSTSRIAVGTCFDVDCIRSHGHVPLRLCQECFSALHPVDSPANAHCRHSGHGSVWAGPLERVMVEAIVKLLRETSTQLSCELSSEGDAAKRPKWLRQLEAAGRGDFSMAGGGTGGGTGAGAAQGAIAEIALSDERRMLSRFGIWLMAAHCVPNGGPDASIYSVGYLLSDLFQWFATTALLPNDAMGQTLEQLKSDFACEWLNQAVANHYEVFVAELLPQQLEPFFGTSTTNNNTSSSSGRCNSALAEDEAIWDVRAVRREQMRDGLAKLLALAPYDVVSLATWSRVMPHWLHALNTELMDEEELLDLKVPLSKLFEPDLCPLPFEAEGLFEFLAIRLQANSYDEVLRALDWLHLLTRIDIRISLDLLLDMFARALRQLPLPNAAGALDPSLEEMDGNNNNNENNNNNNKSQGQKKPEADDQQQLMQTNTTATSATPTPGATTPIGGTIATNDGINAATNGMMGGQADQMTMTTTTTTGGGIDGGDEAQQQQQEQEQMPTGPLAAQLIMTDILAQQIKLAGGASALAAGQMMERLFAVCAQLLLYPAEQALQQQGWAHTCREPDGDQYADCLRCQQALFLYQVLLQVVELFAPKDGGDGHGHAQRPFNLGGKTTTGGGGGGKFFANAAADDGGDAAREFADWLSEASGSAASAAQKQQQQPLGCTSPRRTPSPRILSASSPAGLAFFASPGVPRKQQQQQQQPPIALQQKSSASLTRAARQEVSTPGGAEMVGALPTEEVDTARAQAAMCIADQTPMAMACVSATVVGVAAHQKEATAQQPAEDGNAKGETAVTGAATENATENQTAAASALQQQQQLFWDTSVGRFRFSLDEMPAQLRLTYVLLSNVDREPDPDVQFFLLSLLKYLLLHQECLSNARREQEHRGFLVWLQENLLIPRLWTLLRSDFSHVGQMAVPLILHAITLPLGDDVFWDTVNQEFTNPDWQSQLKAVDRVLVLAHFIPAAAVRANRALQTALSCAFSHLIGAAYHTNPVVAQKTLLLLESLPHNSLVLICQCLEAQFDTCILDRPLIIGRIQLLSKLLPEEGLLTWDFFIQRFETLALEAQLKAQQQQVASAGGLSGDSMHFVQDLLHSDPMSELYQRKVRRARQSLNEADSVRSIVRSLRESSIRQQMNAGTKGDQVDSLLSHPQLHATLSAASMSPLAISADARYGRMREFTDEESNLCLLLNRVVDMQNPERHTVFLVVSLFVHFLAGKRCGPAENAKKQSVLLRHFNTLLGYSNSEKCFTIPPARLRRAAICNAFLHGLSDILDSNLLIGNQLLAIVLQLLLYLPSPQKFASDAPAADYSLRLLSAQQRHCWLHAVIIILYKYRCDAAPTSESIRKLMFIVVQTIEAQCHRCLSLHMSDAQQLHKSSSGTGGAGGGGGGAAAGGGLIPPEKKERRSAVGLLDVGGIAPPPAFGGSSMGGGGWLSSDDEEEVVAAAADLDDATEMVVEQPTATTATGRSGGERLPPMHEETEAELLEREQRKKCSSSSSSSAVLATAPPPAAAQRPETLKILGIAPGAVEQHGGRTAAAGKSSSFSLAGANEQQQRKDSTRTTFTIGSDVGELSASGDPSANNNNNNRAPAIALHPPPALLLSSGRQRQQQQLQQQKSGAGSIGLQQQQQQQQHPVAQQRHSNKSVGAGTRTSSSGIGGTSSIDGTAAAAAAAGSKQLQCGTCAQRLECFDEETLSLCCIALCTFLHRATALAAPLLPRTLRCVARFIDTPQHAWHESNVFVPGNARSAAKQLVRIILHQLSGSGIALQLFSLQIAGDELHSFWSRVAHSLADFAELNPIAFMQNLLEDIAEGWPMRLTRILHNLAIYVQFVPTEALTNWTAVISQMDALYRRMHAQLSSEATTASSQSSAASASSNVPSGHHHSQKQLAQQQKQLRAELSASVLVISRLLRVQAFATIKGAVQMVEAFGKWLVECLHRCPVDLWDLLTVCTACNRGMIRERDKQILTRAFVTEFVAALKFKCELAEPNYLCIVRMVLQDFGEPFSSADDWTNSAAAAAAISSGADFGGADEADGGSGADNRREMMANAGGGGGTLLNGTTAGPDPWENGGGYPFGSAGADQFNTGAAEAIRPHVPELLEFIADMHVLAKLKKQSASNSDRVGGDLKAGLAEIIALEMSRPSIRDSRTVMRFIPWLYSPPSLAQALPGQFAESVANVRVLSWILLGALHARSGMSMTTNGVVVGGGHIGIINTQPGGGGQQQQGGGTHAVSTGMTTTTSTTSMMATANCCLPVPIACTGQMADYIQFVLAGFADQSKQSVVHMSALFHAFHLCQLWTIYCEQAAAASRSEETLQRTMQQVLDFWARVTPAILQLLSHSKVLADMVNLHFVNTLQALQQVNSAVLCQLYPMWEPVLTAHHAHVPRQLRLKLDAVEAQPCLENPQMRPWLSKVRYKISQIELQTSAASPFYNV